MSKENYRAVIEIDDDRWAKHPYAIRIFDENDNEKAYYNFLDSRQKCYEYADRYDIPLSEIEEEFY